MKKRAAQRMDATDSGHLPNCRECLQHAKIGRPKRRTHWNTNDLWLECDTCHRSTIYCRDLEAAFQAWRELNQDHPKKETP